MLKLNIDTLDIMSPVRLFLNLNVSKSGVVGAQKLLTDSRVYLDISHDTYHRRTV